MVVELLFAALAGLVRSVAGFTTHVERSVPTALVGNVETLCVTVQAQVLCLVAAGGFQELVFVVGSVRAVALQAVADRGRMHHALDAGSVHVRMTGDAQGLRRVGGQLDPRDSLNGTDLMTTCASHRHGGVNELAFRFVLVALDASF